MPALKVKNPTTGVWETVSLATPDAIVPSSLPAVSSFDANDAVLGVDGATGEVVQLPRNAVALGVALGQPMMVGSYATTPGSRAINTASPGTNGQATALLVPRTVTLDRIGAEVTTLAAGSTVRLGVFSSDVYGRPAQVVLDAGTIDSSTLGYKEISISLVLTVGIYWLASVASSGTVALRGHRPDGYGYRDSGSVYAGFTIGGVRLSQSSAGLTTNTAWSNGDEDAPRVVVRVAA